MNFKGRMQAAIVWLAERKLLGFFVLGVSVVLAATIIATGPETEPRIRTEKAWPVSVVEAVPTTKMPSLVTFGRVESRQVANLKTSVGAPVEAVLAPEGTWVDKGDVMIRLETRELELALRRAESEYKRRVAVLTSVKNDYESARKITEHHEALKNIAEQKLARHEELYGKGMISDAIIDEVRQQASERAIALEQHLSKLANFPSLIEQHEAMVSEARAVLETSKIELAQTEIRAPFDGRVIETLVSSGDRVSPGVTIVTVADYGNLEVRAAVPAEAGDMLRSRLDAGYIITATGRVDERDVEFTLVRLAGNVKIGQSGLDAFFATDEEVRLDIGRVIDLSVKLPPEENVVALPIQSIYENNRVYRVEENRLVGISAAKVGDYIDADGQFRVLVRSDKIHRGDKLVTTQLPRAITGLLVEPVDAAQFEDALAAETP